MTELTASALDEFISEGNSTFEQEDFEYDWDTPSNGRSYTKTSLGVQTHTLNGWEDDIHSSDRETKYHTPWGDFHVVETFGGEGEGDQYWAVIKLGDRYFRKEGWYASHDGGYLDGDLFEVEPVEKTITVYEVKR